MKRQSEHGYMMNGECWTDSYWWKARFPSERKSEKHYLRDFGEEGY